MKEKRTSRGNSNITELNSKSSKGVIQMKTESQDMFYCGNDCITRYWVWNEEHNCIAYGRIPSPYDELAEELKKQARNRKRVAIGE